MPSGHGLLGQGSAKRLAATTTADTTPPEAKVWEAVCNRKIGFKIRRQHPSGRFIVGRTLAHFYCAEAKLAIEIDGDSHAAPDQAAYDASRTTWVEERGYTVIRFQAPEVGRNLEGVLEAIRGRARRERFEKSPPLMRRWANRQPQGTRTAFVFGQVALAVRTPTRTSPLDVPARL